MATTTNYGWTTPNDTDLVKDGAAAIRTLGSAVDTTTKNLNPSTTLGDIEYRSATANTNTRLGIGSTGQVLTVAGGVPTWATSDDANAIQNAIVDAKGDIVAASAADTPARLAVGTDNQRLVAASAEATGLKYVSDTQNTVVDAEGDLLVGDADNALQRLAIGSNAQVLTVDTTVDGKIKWATPAASGGGLDFISTTSFSAVSSQSVNDVFSATYDNYVIKLNDCTSANDLFVHMRMRVGGVDTSTNYRYQNVQADNTTVTASRSTSATHFSNIGYLQTAHNNDFTFSLTNPFNTQPTSGFSNLTTGASGNIEFNSTGYGLNDSTSYTGFTLITSTSNMTGSVSVYGYKK